MNKEKFLKQKANEIRADVVNTALRNKAGHIAPSLSSVDILTVLYYDSMRYDPRNPLWEERDRVIFSKGHGCYALYAILKDKGIITKEEWENFYTDRSMLSGCVERRLERGLEAGCGSLGHGLPIAVGVAFGARLKKKPYRVFCITGDGEFQEGSMWEAIQFAVKHKLNNLTVIIDHNHLQAMDFIINVMDSRETDLIKRLKGFGLSPVNCPGHDIRALKKAIGPSGMFSKDAPRFIIAETIKGFGLKCMENVPKFHFRIPTDEELSQGKCYE